MTTEGLHDSTHHPTGADLPAEGKIRRLFKVLRTEVVKKLRLRHSMAELNPDLLDRELVFRAPPLTPELVRAIRGISPQLHLRPDERSRRLWERSQNNSCWCEVEALEPLLAEAARPSRVLEIGPGLGRSAVFFKKHFEWQEIPFHLYEGEGAKRRYPLLASRSPDSFRGDFSALRAVLDHNGCEAWEIFDARRLDARLDGLPGPYDLVYSFFGIGFHWSLEPFWDEVVGLLADDGLAVFTIHGDFEPFDRLGELEHGYLTIRRAMKKDDPLNLLVLSRERGRLRDLQRRPWKADEHRGRRRA